LSYRILNKQAISGRDRIHRVRLRDRPTVGALAHPEKNPEADAMNTVPTATFIWPAKT